MMVHYSMKNSAGTNYVVIGIIGFIGRRVVNPPIAQEKPPEPHGVEAGYRVNARVERR
jgi:hypothetical protein